MSHGKTILFGLCLLAGGILAQEPAEAYFAGAGSYAAIYTGKEGYKYPRYILNHPYWEDGDYREGTLSYDGTLYPKVWIRWDQYRDELLLRSPDRRFEVAIPAGRVDYVLTPPHYIARIAGGKELPPGYYLRLYDGALTVWKREAKLLMQSENRFTGLVDTYFEERTQFYVYKDSAYHPVGNRAALLKLLQTKKKELRQYIRSRKLNFRKAPDAAIVDLVRYYEQLNTQ
jgi:hypothetical protein